MSQWPVFPLTFCPVSIFELFSSAIISICICDVIRLNFPELEKYRNRNCQKRVTGDKAGRPSQEPRPWTNSESCLQKQLNERLSCRLSSDYLLEIEDIIGNVEKDDCLWSTLLFNSVLAAMGVSVHTMKRTMEMHQAPFTFHS